jgi:Fanconi anemia group M protein
MSRSHTPQDKTRIVIDDREARSAAWRELLERDDVRASVERLAVGDFVVDNRLVVERKTLFDVAFSVRDGRLFRQASRLAAIRDMQPCLIVEGVERESVELPIPRHAYQGAMVSIALVFHIPVLRTRDPAETASTMLTAARQLRRREHSPRRRHGPQPSTRRRIQLMMLQAIPGIGPVKAKALLDSFCGLRGIANADFDDYRAVDGIGPVIANSLADVFSNAVDSEPWHHDPTS